MMAATQGILIPLPTPLVRAGMLLCAGLSVLGAAALISPSDSQATVPTAQSSSPAQPSTANLAAGAASVRAHAEPSEPVDANAETVTFVGTLQGIDYTADVFMTSTGPRFSVADAQGTQLAELVTLDELRAQHPFAAALIESGSILPVGPATDASPTTP